jgi:hypothetical protein
MKKFLIAGLVTAIAAIGFISQASAASRYCINNPDDPRCYAPDSPGNPPPPENLLPGYDQGNHYLNQPPPPPPPRRPRYNYQDNNDDYSYDDYNDDQGPVFSFQFGNSGGSCSEIGRSLSRAGFRHVKAVDCAGSKYGYTAIRDGQRLRLVVSSANGRIRQITRY